MTSAGSRAGGTLATVLLLAAVAGGTMAASAAVPTAASPKGRQVDIGGGRKVFLRCAGSGSPTVILESGIHDSSDTWTLTQTEPPVPRSPTVFDGIAKLTRVCRYDRPGTLRSTTSSPSITPLFGDLWPRYEELLNYPGLDLDREPTWETVDADEAIATLEAGPAPPPIPIAVLSKTEPFGTAAGTPVDLTTPARVRVARGPAVDRGAPAPDPARARHRERPLRADARSRSGRQCRPADARPHRGQRGAERRRVIRAARSS